MKHMLDRLSGKPDAEDNAHAEAKMQVLHELRNMAMNMMGDKVKDKMPGPVGPPDSLNAEKDSGYGEHLDSKEPHQGSNHSDMDKGAGEVEGRIALGRHEPAGDQGEPDQAEPSEEYRELSDEDDSDDMSHDEIDSMIEELQAKKRAKSMKA